ncbi:MAG: hypothetical protein EXR73_07695 [Myxococcales bacterium]|nr:hypothetical protein [Myxococcales bacterium]
MRERFRRFVGCVGGTDGAGRTALPLGEFVHPAPLLALVLLAVNDHLLKGSGLLPGALTGKLSDFAGVYFFPLLATAACDTLLWALARVTGQALDFSLSRRKLAVAIAATAIGFTAVELSGTVASLYVDTLGRLGFPSAAMSDSTDLFALLMLVPAWQLGMAHLRGVPLGRLEAIARARPHHVRARLDDVRALHCRPDLVDELAARYAAWLAHPAPDAAARVDEVLRTLRALS